MQTSMTAIESAFQTLPGGKVDITTKFKEQSWIGVCASPDAHALARVVLHRIEHDTGELKKFIDMLNVVSGMDQIVKKITQNL